jgi:antitoxin CcdA
MARRTSSAASKLKRPTNVSVSADLLEAAKINNINLSQTLEHALADKLRRIAQERWLAENSDALDDYNRRITKSGVFSDGRRRF